MQSAPGPPARLAAEDRRLIYAVGVVVLVAVGIYRVLFIFLFDQWLTDRLYSHGFVVPLVSLYLLWAGKDRLKQTPIRPAPWLGAVMLFVSTGLLAAGRWGAFVQIEAVSFLFFLPAVILFLWGAGYLRVLLFPVLYLQFMVPWLDPVLPIVQKPFQLVSAYLSVWLFKVLGVPVYHDGIFIGLPGISLEVARECSGVHFMLSVMAVGIPLVYLTQRTWRRAAVVLVAGAIITILANGLRIVIDGLFGMHYGAELLHGPGHIFRGWFVAQVGWIGIFMVNWLTMRGGDRSVPRLCDHWRLSEAGQADPASTSLRRFGVLGCGLLAILVVLEAAGPSAVPLKKPIEAFPDTIGQWTGQGVDWPEAKKMFPGAAVTLSRVYQDASGHRLRLFLGYAALQQDGKNLVSYAADPLHDKTAPVSTRLLKPWPSDFGEGVFRLGATSYQAVFWYQFPDFGTSSKLKAKLEIVRDAFLKRRSNGMVVLVAVPVLGLGRDNLAFGTIVDFLEQMRPHLSELMLLSVAGDHVVPRQKP